MTRTRRTFLAIILTTVVGIGAMGALKYNGASHIIPPGLPQIIRPDPVHVTISSSVTKQRWMEAMAQKFMQSAPHTANGTPIRIEVKGVLSGDSMERILAKDEQPVAWSPGESSWVAQLSERWKSTLGGEPFSKPCSPTVYTPSGIAMWRPMAEALGWPNKPISWKTITALAADPQGWASHGHPEWGQFKLGYTHPKYSSAGLLFLSSVIYGQLGKVDGLTPEDVYSKQVEDALTAISRNTAKYGMVTTNLLEMMAQQGPDFLHAIAGFEEGVIRFNLERGKDLRFPLAFIFPAEGTFWSDHPFCILDKAPWVTPEQAEAATQFRDFLLAKEQQATAGDYFIRPLNASLGTGAYLTVQNGTDPSARPGRVKSFEVPGAATAAAIIDQFLATKKKARIMLVLDTSGSMNGEPMRAATEATSRFLKRVDPRDSVGLIAFNDTVTPVSGFQQASQSAEGLSQRVLQMISGGGTNLNGAICKAAEMLAEQATKDSASDQHLNGIVLLSDGADTSGTISETRMLQTCLPASRETNGLKVFAIAFGESADLDALKRIAYHTGGTVFPADVRTIDQAYLKISAEQ